MKILRKVFTRLCTLREKCPYSGFFWSVFFRIWTEYGEMLRISPYSAQMLENMDHNYSEYKRFLRSDTHNKTMKRNYGNWNCYMLEILILIFFYVPDYYKTGDYKYDIFTEKNSKFLFYRFNDFLGRWKA